MAKAVSITCTFLLKVCLGASVVAFFQPAIVMCKTVSDLSTSFRLPISAPLAAHSPVCQLPWVNLYSYSIGSAAGNVIEYLPSAFLVSIVSGSFGLQLLKLPAIYNLSAVVFLGRLSTIT